MLRNPWILLVVACALAVTSAAWVLHLGSGDHSETCDACLHGHAAVLSPPGANPGSPDQVDRLAWGSTRPPALLEGLCASASPRGPPHS